MIPDFIINAWICTKPYTIGLSNSYILLQMQSEAKFLSKIPDFINWSTNGVLDKFSQDEIEMRKER